MGGNSRVQEHWGRPAAAYRYPLSQQDLGRPTSDIQPDTARTCPFARPRVTRSKEGSS